ncbi:MAG: AAA family ATPase, partial [Victivallales bacterium]
PMLKGQVVQHLLTFLPKKKETDIGKRIREVLNDPSLKDEFDKGGFDRFGTSRFMAEVIMLGSMKPQLKKIVEDIIRDAKREKARLSKGLDRAEDPFKKRLDEIGKVFRLDNDEIQLLTLLYISGYLVSFSSACCNGRHELDGRFSREKFRSLTLLSGFTETRIKKIMGTSSPLQKYGVIDRDFTIGQHIVEFIEGFSEQPLISRYYRKFEGEPVDIGAHSQLLKHVDIIRNMIVNRKPGNAVNILLYGTAGTGKTEFCRSMARHLGMDLFEINTLESELRPESGSRFRFAALRVCQDTTDISRNIILVDEADEMLNGESTSLFSFGPARNTAKDILNEILDTGNGVCFWICNHHRFIEDSTRRRFDYSIEFRKFSVAQREAVWKSCVKKHGLEKYFPENETKLLAAKYEVNAGGIDIALKNFAGMAGSMSENGDDKWKNRTIHRILEPHMRLMTGSVETDKFELCRNYTVEGLNIKGVASVPETLRILRSFCQNMTAGPVDLSSEIRNMNVLLYGPPGAGKTEFAKYLASELGKHLMVKRGSDILDMFVGGTERNISAMFMEAETDGAILFIDEADGLIAERRNAVRSWEVTQVNEFLSRMEQFNGILICATNFKKNMDAASIRRFNIKLEFNYLKSAGCALFFQKMLQPLTCTELNAKDLEILNNIDGLTPGDFKVVRQKYMFMPRDEISNEILLNELISEVSNKNEINSKRIGF